ncbi:MAG: SUMF1/EgtB/PvdO family nonheme iron enzyme, partial [Planctomycetota bacterium]|nr:SUMF1/EgtB/PvdO family nonheme iron enzyme [Planctomycetota bacterium]
MSQREPTNDELIQALKLWKASHKLTQLALSSESGISQGTLSKLLTGMRQRLSQATRLKLMETIPRSILTAASEPPTPRNPSTTSCPTVFISSTYLDNAKRRERLNRVAARAGFTPLSMEAWTADERSVSTISLERVSQADVFLGLIAWRYGWTPPGETKSITELEYEEAWRCGIPRLMFLIEEDLSSVNPMRDFDETDKWRKQEQLEDFKDRIRSSPETPRPFTDEELPELAMQALFEWKQRHWTQASDGHESPPVSIDEDSARWKRESDYLDDLAREYGSIRLAGFKKRLRVNLQLEQLYLPLRADLFAPSIEGQHATSKEVEGDEDAKWFHSEEVSLHDALEKLKSDKRKGLVLLGNPGSGKTTELQRILLGVIREGSKSVGLPPGLVPIFLTLRSLRDSDDSLAALAKRLIIEQNPLDEDFPTDLLGQDNLLWLIDGLDEVSAPRRQEVRDWVADLAANNVQRGYVIVTCRHEGYRGVTDLDFLRLELRQLTNEMVGQFVRNWHRAVELGALSDPSEADRERARKRADENADLLLERLSAPHIRDSGFYEMTVTPLLLAALCLVNNDRRHLPDRREELYEECVDSLLRLWRENKGLLSSYEDGPAQRILQTVAFEMHKEGLARAGIRDIRDALEKALERERWYDMTPESFLATIRDESGILTGFSADTFGFLHLGFQEYLAALEIHKRFTDRALGIVADGAQGDSDELDLVVQNFGSSWWAEVTYLLLAVKGGQLFTPFFRRLIPTAGFMESGGLVRLTIGDSKRFDPLAFLEFIKQPLGDEEDDLARHFRARGLIESFAPRCYRRERLAVLTPEIVRAVEAVENSRTSDRSTLPGTTSQERFIAQRGGYELVRIPGEEFLMGSSEQEAGRFPNEGPEHTVVVPDFYLGIHPVTNQEYARFLKENPSAREPKFWGDGRFNKPVQPVVGVSWDEANAYCVWAGLVLPSEAQWEYACRAGSTGPYHPPYGSEEVDLAKVGWFDENSEGRLHAVGELAPNKFGLYDMHGNVWEWCQDNWSGSYEESQGVHPQAFEDGSSGRV